MRAEWSFYAVIDKEGRAGNIDAARRVLGGVAPQEAKQRAVAKVTPLYKIDGAFAAVRKAALNDSGGWGDALDIEAFVETGERVVLALQKADDSFTAVFASKGSTMLSKIYDEAKASVDSAASDIDSILKLLEGAGAPGLDLRVHIHSASDPPDVRVPTDCDSVASCVEFVPFEMRNC